MTSILRVVFSWLIIYIDSNRELLAVALNPASSKWSATIVISTPLQNTYYYNYYVKTSFWRNNYVFITMCICRVTSAKLALNLTHWGRVTHICVGKPTIIGSDNGLSPERRQAIIWTNAGILLIGPLGTNFSEILIEIQTFSLKKIRLKMSSAICCSFRLGLSELTHG